MTAPAEIAALLQAVRDVNALEETVRDMLPRSMDGRMDTTVLLRSFTTYADELVAKHASEVAALTQERDKAQHTVTVVSKNYETDTKALLDTIETLRADLAKRDAQIAIDRAGEAKSHARAQKAEADLATARQELAQRGQLQGLDRQKLEDAIRSTARLCHMPISQGDARALADIVFNTFGTPRTEAECVKGLVEMGYTKAKLRTSDGWHEGADGYTRRPKYDCDILIAPTPEGA